VFGLFYICLKKKNAMTIHTFETISQELRGRVAILTLNRPEAMNAINMKMRGELRTALDELKRDAQVDAVILTGAGEKAFSAGMDLREFAAMNANIPVAEMKRFRWEQGEGIAAFDKPIIAAINGLAIGGGVELTLLCDFAFAADHSSFAFGEVKRGLIPGNGGTQRLSRRVGTARALDMILTGRTVKADEALSIGLVQYVVPQNELIEQALKLAEMMAANAPVAVRSAKAAIHRGADLTLADGLRLEQDMASFLYTTEDSKEGPKAFLEKRPAVWKGQ
jgi:enoyl-CoA hydratase/carnithine racemase